MKKNFSHGLNKKRGVTVLVASLVASILLAIGLSIFNTTVKDLLFSASGRDSAVAFYAADTGADCALYWDNQASGIFATSTQGQYFPPNVISCARTIVSTSGWVIFDEDNGNSRAKTTFKLGQSGSDAICADVIVTKVTEGTAINTTIQVRGFNTCDLSNPRRLERGIEFSY